MILLSQRQHPCWRPPPGHECQPIDGILLVLRPITIGFVTTRVIVGINPLLLIQNPMIWPASYRTGAVLLVLCWCEGVPAGCTAVVCLEHLETCL